MVNKKIGLLTRPIFSYRNYYGNIPQGWTTFKLNDFGYFKKGPFGSSLTKSMFVDKNTHNCVKVYEQKNAIQHNCLIGNYYISHDKYIELKSFEVFPNDIIVSCAGTIGEIYKLPQSAEKGIINQALMKISLYDISTSDYFKLILQYTLHKLSNKVKGTAIKNIVPFEILKPAQVIVPPLSEQRKIINKIDLMKKLLLF